MKILVVDHDQSFKTKIYSDLESLDARIRFCEDVPRLFDEDLVLIKQSKIEEATFIKTVPVIVLFITPIKEKLPANFLLFPIDSNRLKNTVKRVWDSIESINDGATRLKEIPDKSILKEIILDRDGMINFSHYLLALVREQELTLEKAMKLQLIMEEIRIEMETERIEICVCNESCIELKTRKALNFSFFVNSYAKEQDQVRNKNYYRTRLTF